MSSDYIIIDLINAVTTKDLTLLEKIVSGNKKLLNDKDMVILM